MMEGYPQASNNNGGSGFRPSQSAPSLRLLKVFHDNRHKQQPNEYKASTTMYPSVTANQHNAANSTTAASTLLSRRGHPMSASTMSFMSPQQTLGGGGFSRGNGNQEFTMHANNGGSGGGGIAAVAQPFTAGNRLTDYLKQKQQHQQQQQQPPPHTDPMMRKRTLPGGNEGLSGDSINNGSVGESGSLNSNHHHNNNNLNVSSSSLPPPTGFKSVMFDSPLSRLISGRQGTNTANSSFANTGSGGGGGGGGYSTIPRQESYSFQSAGSTHPTQNLRRVISSLPQSSSSSSRFMAGSTNEIFPTSSNMSQSTSSNHNSNNMDPFTFFTKRQKTDTDTTTSGNTATNTNTTAVFPMPHPIIRRSNNRDSHQSQQQQPSALPFQDDPKMQIAAMHADSLLHNSCKLYPNDVSIVEAALQLDPQAIRREVPIMCGSGTGKSPYRFPINIALKYGANIDIVTLLAEGGPEVLELPDGPEMQASLGIAILSNASMEVMERLLARNHKTAACADRHSNFPLHLVVRSIHPHICCFSVVERVYSAYPAALKARNFHGRTPVEMAVRNPSCPEDVLNYLQKATYGKGEEEEEEEEAF